MSPRRPAPARNADRRGGISAARGGAITGAPASKGIADVRIAKNLTLGGPRAEYVSAWIPVPDALRRGTLVAVVEGDPWRDRLAVTLEATWNDPEIEPVTTAVVLSIDSVCAGLPLMRPVARIGPWIRARLVCESGRPKIVSVSLAREAA